MSTFDSSPFESLPGGSSSRGGAFFDGVKRGLGVGGSENKNRRNYSPTKADWENSAKMKWFEHQLGQHGETTAHARAKERHTKALDAVHEMNSRYGVTPTSIKTEFGSANFAKNGRRSQGQVSPEYLGENENNNNNNNNTDVVNLDDLMKEDNDHTPEKRIHVTSPKIIPFQNEPPPLSRHEPPPLSGRHVVGKKLLNNCGKTCGKRKIQLGKWHDSRSLPKFANY
jgi:hypothetical protein